MAVFAGSDLHLWFGGSCGHVPSGNRHQRCNRVATANPVAKHTWTRDKKQQSTECRDRPLELSSHLPSPYPCLAGGQLAHVPANIDFFSPFSSLDLRAQKNFMMRGDTELNLMVETFNVL